MEPTESTQPAEPAPPASAPLAPAPPAPPPMSPPPMAAPMAAGRPTGVTVVAIISAIYGALATLGGLLLILGASVLGGLAAGSDAGVLGGALAGVGIFFAALVILIAVGFLATAYGLWNRRSWSWMLGMILWIITLVFAILGLAGGINASNIIGLVAAGVSVYFLWQPEVKRYLGRA
jgi:hypothetical protein